VADHARDWRDVADEIEIELVVEPLSLEASNDVWAAAQPKSRL
jgi:hypothetical protein